MRSGREADRHDRGRTCWANRPTNVTQQVGNVAVATHLDEDFARMKKIERLAQRVAEESGLPGLGAVLEKGISENIEEPKATRLLRLKKIGKAVEASRLNMWGALASVLAGAMGVIGATPVLATLAILVLLIELKDIEADLTEAQAAIVYCLYSAPNRSLEMKRLEECMSAHALEGTHHDWLSDAGLLHSLGVVRLRRGVVTLSERVSLRAAMQIFSSPGE